MEVKEECRSFGGAPAVVVSRISILAGKCGMNTNCDADMGKARDWALLGDRTSMAWANMNRFWIHGHDRWRRGDVQRDDVRRGATVCYQGWSTTTAGTADMRWRICRLPRKPSRVKAADGGLTAPYLREVVGGDTGGEWRRMATKYKAAA